ncbi:MAG: hypothetical protein KF703_10085 [Actinobacteria bacterium]|nr:hypothetical protein [Actinomycetota bacterium]
MTSRAHASAEDGTGLVGSLATVVVFVSLLLFAAHVLVALYARSVVSAAGFDAARSVASREVDHGDPVAVAAAQQQADVQLRRLLGRMGDRAQVSWQVDPDVVELRIEVPVPGLGVPGLDRPLGLEEIERVFTVRVEDVR